MSVDTIARTLVSWLAEECPVSSPMTLAAFCARVGTIVVGYPVTLAPQVFPSEGGVVICAQLAKRDGRLHIAYHPARSVTMIAVAVCHELGHILCGHLVGSETDQVHRTCPPTSDDDEVFAELTGQYLLAYWQRGHRSRWHWW